MIDIRHYEPQSASEWNAFVAESKNGTFLFDRRYMDYHSDRFADSSFMVCLHCCRPTGRAMCFAPTAD